MSRAKKLTVADVEKMIDGIKKTANNHDYEIAHSLEDMLYEEVLRAIAVDKAVDPKACAKTALKASRMQFNRWCG